jgi:hypothetical protein
MAKMAKLSNLSVTQFSVLIANNMLMPQVTGTNNLLSLMDEI